MKNINHGQPNIRGINYQQWAAIALFLQYCKFNDFKYIHLEPKKDKDFNLKLERQTLICEAKNRQKALSHSLLLSILKDIQKNKPLSESIKILVVCNKVSNTLLSDVKNYKYWTDKIKLKFERYSNKELSLLPFVDFWIIDQEKLKSLVYALFEDTLNYWLPEKMMSEKLKSILIDKFYDGSAVGKKYYKNEFIKFINENRKKIIEQSTLFNNKFSDLNSQFENIIIAARDNKKPKFGEFELASLSAQANKFLFLLDRLKEKKLALSAWGKLWNLINIHPFYFRIFDIFNKNISNEKNKKYILKYIMGHTKTIRKFYQSGFFDIDVVKTTKKILEDDKDNKFIEDVFEIVKKLITERGNDFFYLKTQRDSSWELSEITKTLQKIYEKANIELKEKIYKLIINAFNLIKDEGEFDHYVPREVFQIVETWLSNNFKDRFAIFIKELSNQYAKFYKKFGENLKFKGWEHMGSGVSFSGSYHISDRHFVSYVLAPAINKFYDQNKDRGWNFILSNCVTKTENVSVDKPDFLNRAVCQIVLNRYAEKDPKISNEAFDILSEFILSRNGIPHKSDLIYQILIGLDIPDDKKLKLVKVSTDKYKAPISVFVEQIISDLVKKEDKEAKEILIDWFNNPEYYKKIQFDSNVIQNIKNALEADLYFGIKLFNTFINSKFFIEEYDSFDVYEFARILHSILKKSFGTGKEILIKLMREKKLTKNQQILLCYSILQNPNNPEKDKKEDLIRIYGEFVNKFLDSLDNDIDKIYNRIDHSNAREAFIQFAEKLTINKEMEKALRIVEVFINDPDPFLPGKDPEDKEAVYNEHKRIVNGEKSPTITSIRGWCSWVLMKCSVLAGRDYIKKIIDLTEQLTKDENWYIKHMSCFALSQLAQARLTVLPNSVLLNNKDILFFGKNTKEALIRAKKVEDIAFDLLEDMSNGSNNVKKVLGESVLSVFDQMRALSEKDVLRFIKLIKKFPDEVIAKAGPLLIFFAEFRKNAFKDWKWAIPGHYDYLKPGQYNSGRIEKEVFKIIDDLKPEERFSFGASCERMIRENDSKSKDAEKYFEIAYRYLKRISKDYHENTLRIIYNSIQEGIQKDWHFNKWLDLYLNCLEKENKYYKDNLNEDNVMKMSWWPYYENSKILELIYNHKNKNEFLNALEIIVNFPKGIDIHESEAIIPLLEKFPKTNKQVKSIINKLFERNPAKYYEFRKKYLGKE